MNKHILALILNLMLVSAVFLSCDNDNKILKGDLPEPYLFNNLSTLRTDWKMSSVPYQISSETERSTIYWYNPIELVPVDDIFDVDISPGYEAMRTLKVVFEPNDSATSWAGITNGDVNSLTYTPDYFEMVAKGNSGKIHMEFGFISEDIDGDGMADNEDKDFNGSTSEEEDVGLDGLADPDEPGYDPVTNPDPNGDNWYFEGYGKCPLTNCESLDWSDPSSPNYYRYINGTEGNIYDMLTYAIPDKEVLNINRGFVTINSYYSYSIDLESSDFVVDSLTLNGWKRYRLPIGDSLAYQFVSDGYFEPDWRHLYNVRLWFESDAEDDNPDTLEIAGLYFSPDTTTVDTNVWVDDSAEYFRDYEYEINRIFDLGLPGELKIGDSIVSLLIYESISTTQSDSSKPLANLWVNPFDTSLFTDENVHHNNSLRVNEIEPDQYEFYSQPDINRFYIYFISRRSSVPHLGYYMEVKRGDSIISFGDISNDIFQLKLLSRSQYKAEPTDQTWQLMWRNCYRVEPGVDAFDIEVNILKGEVGEELNPDNLDYQIDDTLETKYIEILGLDQYNNSSMKVPDGLLDNREEVFRPDWGLIIFPAREPFNSDTTFTSGLGWDTPPLNDKVENIYNYDSFSEKYSNSKYYLRVYYKERITFP